MTLTLMCGLSFSGKTTLARQLGNALSADIISLDEINTERGLDGGQGIAVEEWAETNRLAHLRAGRALAAGREVVIDDTGSPRFLRERWRHTAAEAGAPFVLVWVRIDSARQHARVVANRRTGRRLDVTDEVLTAHVESFEDPTLDEHPVVVDADDTTSAARVQDVVHVIRHMSDR